MSADHLPISFSILENGKTFDKQYKITNTNWEGYSRLLDQLIKPRLVADDPDILDRAIENFSASLRTAFSLNTTHQTAPYPIQLTPEINILLTRKKHLRQLFGITRDPVTKTALNWVTRTIKKKIKKLSNDNWQDTINECNDNIMKLWRISRALTNNPIENGAKIIHGSTGVQYEPDDQANTIADTLELQFQPNTIADVDLEEEIQTFTDDYLANIRPNMQFELKTTPAKLKDLITRLNTRKACGPDGISGLMLKNMNRKALVHLTHIYNKCFHLNHFPTPWKTAKIITIPKTGQNPRFPQNRRPISLLSILAKSMKDYFLKK